MTQDEDQFYETAANEVASKAMVTALAAKAFAEADGDERRAIARYINLRVEQLRLQHQQNTARNAEKEKRRLAEEKLRTKEAMRHLNSKDVAQLRSWFSFYSTEKLKHIYAKRDTVEFRAEAYEAARQLLFERGFF